MTDTPTTDTNPPSIRQSSMRCAVAERIKSLDISQREVATECGIAASTLSLFLSGHRDMRCRTAEVIMQYLGLQIVPSAETPKVKGKPGRKTTAKK